METTEAEIWLCAQLRDYCDRYELPAMSADELTSRLREQNAEANADHIKWLEGFSAVWDLALQQQ